MKKDETQKDTRDHEILEDEKSPDVNKGKTKSKEKEQQKNSEEKSKKKKEEAQQPEAEKTEPAEEKETDPLQILMDQLAQTEEQKKDLEDKFIRLVAEFDNYKKRMSRDFERQSEMVREKILLSLLPIMDDLDRLLQHEGAMMTRKSEEYDVPTVVEEFEKGYKINDKVLRHARVVVSAAE
ncbi:MAG: Protein GrpE [Marinimicrobia bacterium 46_47]|nr:MAG: Protein GrpE [Marinimicrobia bacterium 46_47]